jgi:hypothetical protein
VVGTKQKRRKEMKRKEKRKMMTKKAKQIEADRD